MSKDNKKGKKKGAGGDPDPLLQLTFVGLKEGKCVFESDVIKTPKKSVADTGAAAAVAALVMDLLTSSWILCKLISLTSGDDF